MTFTEIRDYKMYVRYIGNEGMEGLGTDGVLVHI